MTTLPFGVNLAAITLQNYYGPVMLRSRSMGGIIPDITISERHLDTLAITDHPVERNAVISDHCFMLPYEVVLTYGWSNSSRNAGGDQTYVDTLYYELKALQEAREPFTILTGKRVYTDMLLHRLLTETNQDTENSLIVVAECRQVIIVGTQLLTVPANSQQAAPQITGAVQNNGSVAPSSSNSYNSPAAQESLPSYSIP
jgi:Dit-like phage tail protein